MPKGAEENRTHLAERSQRSRECAQPRSDPRRAEEMGPTPRSAPRRAKEKVESRSRGAIPVSRHLLKRPGGLWRDETQHQRHNTSIRLTHKLLLSEPLSEFNVSTCVGLQLAIWEFDQQLAQLVDAAPNRRLSIDEKRLAQEVVQRCDLAAERG